MEEKEKEARPSGDPTEEQPAATQVNPDRQETGKEEKPGETTGKWTLYRSWIDKRLRSWGERILQSLQQISWLKGVPFQRLGPRGAVASVLATVLLAALAVVFAVESASVPTSADARVEKTDETAKTEKPKKPKPAKLVLTHGDQTWEIDLRKIGYDGKNESSVDVEKVKDWLKEVKKEVDQPAVDARMPRLGSPIRPAKPGKLMDLEQVEEWVTDWPGWINKPRKIPLVPDQPEVTEEDLRQVGAKRISRYTTYYNPGNLNRTTNLRLSSQAIHNRVLNPGEVFSFNQTVGPRTEARGYKPATIIVRGEYSEGIGGGICQTSSTLYNSVDAAGLRIVSRFSHSKEVTYVPPGRDATVAWNGPDFRFQNSLSKPILIKSYLNHGALTVEIYSTPEANPRIKQVQAAPTEVESMPTSSD